MGPRRAIALVLSSVVILATTGCKTTQERQESVIARLEIQGTSNVSEGDIKDKLVTTQQGWNPLAAPPRFDADAWEADLKRIPRYYRERGFYQARVVGSEVAKDPTNPDKVILKVQVEEGQPTLVRSIALNGIDTLPPDHARPVREAIPLHEGDLFVEHSWEGVKEKMTATLREQGYAAARVTGLATVDLAVHVADLTLQAQPGLRYRFGQVRVRQDEHPRVEEWRIREQVEAVLHPGEWYSESAMELAQARIFRMGIFGAVKVRRGRPDPESGLVPIDVEVQEGTFHSIRLGGSFEVDQTHNQIQGLGEYTHRDFFGGLRRLTVTGEAGWAWLPSLFTSVANGGRNGPVARLSADLNQPRLGFRDLSLATRAELEKGLEPTYAYYGGRFKLGLVWTPSTYLHLGAGYGFEAYRLSSGTATLGGASPTLLFGCPETCILSYLEQRVEWDRRDDGLEPREGFYLALSFQEGGGPLGGSFSYLRVLPEARGYLSFLRDKRLTFAAKVKAGTLHPFGIDVTDTPIVARFFAGGGNSVRSFSSRRLGPMAVIPKPQFNPKTDPEECERDPFHEGCPGSTEPIGGNGLFESTLEARYKLFGPLTLAAFIDAGFVTTEELQVSKIGENLLYAVGAGVRYRTPVGPIRVDFAYRPDVGPPLQVYQPDGTTLTYPRQTGCFGIGGGASRAGAPEGRCALIFSIGEAF